MKLSKLSWRNIWRHPARSLLVIASISFGILAGLFLASFYQGMGKQRVKSAISYETSHLQLHHPNFLKDYDPRFGMAPTEFLRLYLDSSSPIKNYSKRSIVAGMISSASGNQGIRINGVDMNEEKNVTYLDQKLKEGELPANQNTQGLVISKKIASKLGIHVGSKAILTFQDTSGNIVSGSFRVTGLFVTNNSRYDEMNVFVQRQTINELLAVDQYCNEIAILLKDDNDLNTMKEDLQEKFPVVETVDWKTLSPEVDLVISTLDQTSMIYMTIILIALMFGIINTMLMSVLERTREIGMLMAVGMNKIRVFGMIVLETCFLVIAGIPLGILSAWSLTTYLNQKGMDLQIFSKAFESFGYSSIVYPELAVKQYVLVIIMVSVAAILSAIYPAYKALKLKPVEAIRK
jgi:putative ABC transport system permease protein